VPNRFIRAFLRDERGGTMLLMAIGLLASASVAALAIDIGYFYLIKGRLQTTADVSALAAVRQLPDEDAARTAAVAYAALNMPTNQHGSVLASADIMTGNWDSGSRTFTPAGAPLNAVEVVTRRSQANGNAAGAFFARIIEKDSIDIKSSAIAVIGTDGEACVLALSGSASGAVSTSGGAIVSLDACSVMANSNAADAVSVGGGSVLEVECVSTAGGLSGSPTMDCASANEGISAFADPYASLAMPVVSYCDKSGNYSAQNGSLTDINGDGYIKVCGRLTIKGTFTLENNRTYIIEDAFAVNSGASASATGVTFIVQDSVTINGGSIFSISAPTEDREFDGQSGMVFIQDPSTSYSPSNKVKLNGGSNTEFTGVIYVPNNDVTFTGGNASNNNGCTQIVALTVSFSGNADVDSECSLLGVTVLDLSGPSSLVR
jgi:Flp pilus assembly protein TadG